MAVAVKRQRIVIGTRGSQLALAQSEMVAAALRSQYPAFEVVLKIISTQGDRSPDQPLPEIGNKGVFTADIEEALRTSEIDCAVHSLKDLPTELPAEFVIAAIPERASPFDALISRDKRTLDQLPRGARIGTGSLRRSAQLLAIRSDLVIVPLRGNVPTRIAKLYAPDSPYDAIVLAAAGLERLKLIDQITQMFEPQQMLPAPGQGAIAVECRADDMAIRDLLAVIDHAPTRNEVEAERGFLFTLDAGCSLPVAALGRIQSGILVFTGRVCSEDGKRVIEVSGDSPIGASTAWKFGATMAEKALKLGAQALL
ncbi:MAG: hydroxymethylbilane synthase [Anaerolineae bacterium]|nr:hydroxymethylbilane synthase [Anaerolineae bacterium]